MSDHHLIRYDLEKLVADNADGAHSIFSASGSAMWANCSGSLIPHLHYPDTTSEEAAEGSVAHELGEQWLRSGIRPDHRVGEVVEVDEFKITVTHTMLDYVQEYVDRCACLPGEHFIETRVDFSDLTPIERQSGTADHAACVPGRLTISDLKYGKGLMVSAQDNTQIALYAWGFFRKYDAEYHFKEIEMRIIQPRLDNYDSWVVSREELIALAEWLKSRAHAAWCHGAERVPGKKQCQWCRAKPDCAAYAVFIKRVMEIDSDGVFDDLTTVTADDMANLAEEIECGMFTMKPTNIGTLTVEQKAVLWHYRKMVEDFFKALDEDLQQKAVQGVHVPGCKVVEGRTDRQYVDERSTVEHLTFLGVPEENLYTRSMIGIGKTEEELRKLGYRRKDLPVLLSSIVSKPKGKPTMVAESDKRPAIDVSSPFESLDDEL